MAKHSIQIDDDKLFEEIVSYCKLNKISIKMFCTDMLRKQFLIEKFGDVPFGTLYSADEDKIITTAIVKKEDNDGDYEGSTIIEIQTNKDGENKTIEVTDIRKSLKQPSAEVEPTFYNEIQIEDVNRTAEETQKHTEKPKKRRL